MTHFQDPKVEQADALAFVKLLHVVGGMYLWEYVNTMWFEWEIVTGRRKHRWTIWLYSGCRLSALLAIIVILIGFDTTRPLNCKVWITFIYVFAYSAFISAAALIVLRVIAIWQRNWIVTTIAVVAWLATLAFYIRNTSTADAVWSSTDGTCVALYTEQSIGAITITLVEDLVLLILMLSGLRRYGEAGMFGLWRLLYHQGLFWLALVTVAEIPTTVLIILNLNGYLNQMFQPPELIMMAVGAARIYRGLADYTCMTEFNWNDEKTWALMGGAISSATVPATTIQFHEIAQVSQPPSPLQDLEMARTEAVTIDISQSKNSSEQASSSTFTEIDLPV
ncbi:hypothetical protein BJV74DRAFT_550801 [Russula compacta]|nr:hypothetical protein BJV74DRAFT_550801 [Russula compacta]